MHIRELAVSGAHVFEPQVHADERGLFVSPFQGPLFSTVSGRAEFSVAQSNHSVSRRGVVRGIHFTRTPPGTAKYVHCARGRSLDFVIDLRVGSPTYLAWDMVEMDPRTFRAAYLPVGVGHAFVALEDDTVMSYIISESYVPENELAVSFFDPEVGLPPLEKLADLPAPVMSQRDTEAMSLSRALELGLLPDYATCTRLEAATHRGPTPR